MNITLYTKANCPQCTAPNEGWRQMPVIIAGGESWSGYRPDKIHELEARCR